MPEVLIPMPLGDFQTKPPLTARVRITEEMQQVLSLLTGYDGAARRLLRVTPTGILPTVNPTIQAFVNITGSGANYTWQGSDIKCTEVIVRAHPDNAGRVWVNVYGAAGADSGWPLDGNEYVPITVSNLNQIHLKIVADGEKVILAYTQ